MAAFLLPAVLCLPAPAEGQIAQLLQAVGNGGSWIRLEVEEGHASYRSPVFPLAGMSITGCLQVWNRQTGSWTVHAKDTMGDDELDITAVPGAPVKFDYKAGFQAQLDVNIEWSEPRDTTLFMWVGLAVQGNQDSDRDICEPPPP